MPGFYKVGDVVTVYHKDSEDWETCDMGERHLVPCYQVKRIRITEVTHELIKALNYVSDGVGEVLYAVDAQGRMYLKAEHWDGPRASLWARITGLKGGFTQFPAAKFSRDVYGRALDLHR